MLHVDNIWVHLAAGLSKLLSVALYERVLCRVCSDVCGPAAHPNPCVLAREVHRFLGPTIFLAWPALPPSQLNWSNSFFETLEF